MLGTALAALVVTAVAVGCVEHRSLRVWTGSPVHPTPSPRAGAWLRWWWQATLRDRPAGACLRVACVGAVAVAASSWRAVRNTLQVGVLEDADSRRLVRRRRGPRNLRHRDRRRCSSHLDPLGAQTIVATLTSSCSNWSRRTSGGIAAVCSAHPLARSSSSGSIFRTNLFVTGRAWFLCASGGTSGWARGGSIYTKAAAWSMCCSARLDGVAEAVGVLHPVAAPGSPPGHRRRMPGEGPLRRRQCVRPGWGAGAGRGGPRSPRRPRQRGGPVRAGIVRPRCPRDQTHAGEVQPRS